MIYFTADLHFGHRNIISLCNRPFETIEEMDEALIANWNRKVTNSDTVYILGDFASKTKNLAEYAARLKGKKVLITGNHDTFALGDDEFVKCFQKITPFLEQSLCKHYIVFCHYPMIEWKNSRKEGSVKLGYLVYGHIHNNDKPEYHHLFSLPNALNAGVDVNNFEPVTFDELTANNAKVYGKYRS